MANDMVMTLTEDNFDQLVLQEDGCVLVDFWAPWCGPCRMVGPIIDELAEDYQGKMKVGKVNVDDNEGLAAKYQVMSIPTIVLFKNGKVADKLVGGQSKDNFEEMIENHLS